MNARVQLWWQRLTSELAFLVVLALMPLIPVGYEFVKHLKNDGTSAESTFAILFFSDEFTKQISILIVYALLALGLHVVVGYTGLLHLGVAAFFGIGAYVAGISATSTYPFQIGFVPALLLSALLAAAASFVLAAPTLRLRGDYLALVTLGFGEVLRFSLRNLENITNGTRAISPIPAAVSEGWPGVDRKMYFISLAILAGVVFMLRNLERSRLGRSWVALREDELAATCMGIDIGKARLSAFAFGSAIAGMAGCLYAFLLNGTAQPDSYDFSRSIMTLCCLILGGLGSIRGVLFGVFLLIGFDNLGSYYIDAWIQEAKTQWSTAGTLSEQVDSLLKFSSWRLMVFGLALILMMRFRPEGLFPAKRVQLEMHEYDDASPEGTK